MARSNSRQMPWLSAAPRPLLLLLLSFLLNLSSCLAYAPLSDASLRTIPSGGADFDIHTGSLLAPILIPRVPGTPGSAKVQEHFVSFFRETLPLWSIEWHNSTSKTPATGDKDVPFSNLIFRRDPPGARAGDVERLTLVAHYDSMYRPEGFVGATDSAAPCAVLMHVARSVERALERKWQREGEGDGDGLEEREEKGVQIVLLDGEEAWVTWTDEDSVYGARALAETWETTPHEDADAKFPTPLSSISLFLLLDLLGDTDPRVLSHFQNTHWAYQHMAEVERRMRRLGLLETKPKTPFLPDTDKKPGQFRAGFIGDDHVPFLRRGVDVLHIIPTPFSAFWHTMDDDGEHLDLPTVRDWARIVTAFVAEWMELEGDMDTLDKVVEDGKDEL